MSEYVRPRCDRCGQYGVGVLITSERGKFCSLRCDNQAREEISVPKLTAERLNTGAVFVTIGETTATLTPDDAISLAWRLVEAALTPHPGIIASPEEIEARQSAARVFARQLLGRD